MWAVWNSWSDCSPTCGQATRMRTRTCNHPPPSDKGRDCEGHQTQLQTCPMVVCPGKCCIKH